MGGEQAAILLVGVVHVFAVCVLLWMLVKAGDGAPGCGFWFGNDARDEPEPPPEPVAPGGAQLPLPVAEQSRVRLREPGRISRRPPAPGAATRARAPPRPHARSRLSRRGRYTRPPHGEGMSQLR